MLILSIIIPIYNGEDYIHGCMSSILSQNLPEEEYEIILINDGSTDKSKDIILEYVDKFKNVRYITQPNQGQATARNTGIKAAHGLYLEFIDVDDILIPNSLLPIYKLVKFYMEEGQTDMITFGISVASLSEIDEFKEKGFGRFKNRNPPINLKFYDKGTIYIELNNFNNGPWYYFIRKEFLLKFNLFFADGKLCEDGMFTINAFVNAGRIIQVGRMIYLYIDRPGSTVNSKDEKRLKRLNEGFVDAIFFITDLIKSKKSSISDKCFENLSIRRDTYIFFLLIRLMRQGNVVKAKEIITKLKTKGLYPITTFKGQWYGKKIAFLIKFVNIPLFYFLGCRIFKLKNKMKK